VLGSRLFFCPFQQLSHRCASNFLTVFKARLELLTHRLQASRQPPPPQITASNDTSLATYAAMQEMLRQQHLAIAVARQRRDDLKREIDQLSRQAETDA
jgi:hypothetical protein